MNQRVSSRSFQPLGPNNKGFMIGVYSLITKLVFCKKGVKESLQKIGHFSAPKMRW
jgi:hypothetical protein